jgi:hypothetical protein
VVQLTALGNPKLLERVSAGLVAIRNLFSQFDLNHDNVVSHEEFESVRDLMATPLSPNCPPVLPSCGLELHQASYNSMFCDK